MQLSSLELTSQPRSAWSCMIDQTIRSSAFQNRLLSVFFWSLSLKDGSRGLEDVFVAYTKTVMKRRPVWLHHIPRLKLKREGGSHQYAVVGDGADQRMDVDWDHASLDHWHIYFPFNLLFPFDIKSSKSSFHFISLYMLHTVNTQYIFKL